MACVVKNVCVCVENWPTDLHFVLRFSNFKVHKLLRINGLYKKKLKSRQNNRYSLNLVEYNDLNSFNLMKPFDTRVYHGVKKFNPKCRSEIIIFLTFPDWIFVFIDLFSNAVAFKNFACIINLLLFQKCSIVIKLYTNARSIYLFNVILRFIFLYKYQLMLLIN